MTSPELFPGGDEDRSQDGVVGNRGKKRDTSSLEDSSGKPGFEGDERELVVKEALGRFLFFCGRRLTMFNGKNPDAAVAVVRS